MLKIWTKRTSFFRQLLIGSGILILSTGTVLAHDKRDPGFSGWVVHLFDVHTIQALVISGIAAFGIWMFIYRAFLEPDFKKEARRKRKSGSGFWGGGGGCSSGGGGSSGCSGCGGD